MLRKEIVLALNKPLKTNTLYDELKLCLTLAEDQTQDMDSIDEWFFGIIQSLFYRPCSKSLVFSGPQGIGKTEFFRRLFPQKKWFSDKPTANEGIPSIYSHLVVDLTEFPWKSINQTISNDGFKIAANCSIDKRLASVCYTTNSAIPVRSNFITIFLKDIDRIRFNSLDKELLWIEIYHRFLAEHAIVNIFDLEDINSFFGE